MVRLSRSAFLSWGQRSFFHWLMASSSRSRARPVGRWQVQSSLRRLRHTCETSYRTPHCRSISLAVSVRRNLDDRNKPVLAAPFRTLGAGML
jgi:hypothetical protein